MSRVAGEPPAGGEADVSGAHYTAAAARGVVTAAVLLSVAAFTGRIADAPIRTHEPVAEPDTLITQDPTLLHQPGLLAGLTQTASC